MPSQKSLWTAKGNSQWAEWLISSGREGTKSPRAGREGHTGVGPGMGGGEDMGGGRGMGGEYPFDVVPSAPLGHPSSSPHLPPIFPLPLQHWHSSTN